MICLAIIQIICFVVAADTNNIKLYMTNLGNKPPKIEELVSERCPLSEWDWSDQFPGGTFSDPSPAVAYGNNAEEMCNLLYKVFESQTSVFRYVKIHAFLSKDIEFAVGIATQNCQDLCESGFCLDHAIPVECRIIARVQEVTQIMIFELSPVHGLPTIDGHVATPCDGYEDWSNAVEDGLFINPSWAVAYGAATSEASCGMVFRVDKDNKNCSRFHVIRAFIPKAEVKEFQIGIAQADCLEICDPDLCLIFPESCNIEIENYPKENVKVFTDPDPGYKPRIECVISTPCEGFQWDDADYTGTLHDPSWAVSYSDNSPAVCGDLYKLSRGDSIRYVIVAAFVNDVSLEGTHLLAIENQDCNELCGPDSCNDDSDSLPVGCIIERELLPENSSTSTSTVLTFTSSESTTTTANATTTDTPRTLPDATSWISALCAASSCPYEVEPHAHCGSENEPCPVQIAGTIERGDGYGNAECGDVFKLSNSFGDVTVQVVSKVNQNEPAFEIGYNGWERVCKVVCVEDPSTCASSPTECETIQSSGWECACQGGDETEKCGLCKSQECREILGISMTGARTNISYIFMGSSPLPPSGASETIVAFGLVACIL